jgi:hypothetical protein
MEGVQMSEPIYFSTNSHPISNPTTQIMRVDLDGGFTVNESIPATDAAKEVLRIMKEQWFADAQATKIRELQSDVTQLENRLRALWDKLEGERKHYMERIVELEKENERINRLERAGDMLCAAAAFLGWHGEIEQWNKVKVRKP